MAPGLWQLLLVAAVALLLFGGKGKLSSMMGDMAKGITAFRKGLKDEDTNKDSMVNVTPPKKDENA